MFFFSYFIEERGSDKRKLSLCRLFMFIYFRMEEFWVCKILRVKI